MTLTSLSHIMVTYDNTGVLHLKFVRSLENFIGNHLEDFFNKKFSSGVQPIEIAKRISRLIESDKTVGVANVCIPDQYAVFLTLQDFNKLESSFPLIIAELRTYIHEYARKKGYTLSHRLAIDIQADKTLSRGTFQVLASFSEAEPDDQSLDALPSNDDFSGTRVFDKPVPAAPQAAPSYLRGTLKVLEGSDAGLVLDIAGKRINIGRRDSNELSLNDVNISRLHAYILYEQDSHVVYDAKSLNGTYVNQHRIARKQLRSGDRIKLGNTVILYEVKKRGE